jgi:hypothetical protein
MVEIDLDRERDIAVQAMRERDASGFALPRAFGRDDCLRIANNHHYSNDRKAPPSSKSNQPTAFEMEKSYGTGTRLVVSEK